MNKRPQRSDSEKDILLMQTEFLQEKEKCKDFQPAAKVIRLYKDKPLSKFAQSRRNKPKSIDSKPSSNIVIGDVIEKCNNLEINDLTRKVEKVGFPKTEVVDKMIPITKNKSIFAQIMQNKLNLNKNTDESNSIFISNSQNNIKNISSKSYVCSGNMGEEIHNENINKMSQMNEDEIIAERNQLLQQLDPSLITMLQARRNRNITETNNKHDESIEKTEYLSERKNYASIPYLKILEENTHWLNFNIVEKDKLEWMNDIKNSIPDLRPGEKFEARFDWKGVLLPYTENNQENDNRELYLHGEDSHRPGYTIKELFRLARSNILQQRVSSINAISGILNIYSQGFYDKVLDLPISKIFFLLRFALDENITIIIEATSKALATLFYNDTDEVMLDTLFDSTYGIQQPQLCNKFNKDTSVDNVTSKLSNININDTIYNTSINDNEMHNKNSLHDFHLAEIDLIECLLRTNILSRIRYIITTLKPDNSTVISCIKLLIRLARSGEEAINKILSTNNLIESLIKNFLPSLHLINTNDATNIYNNPQYYVIKLFRVIASQNIKTCTIIKTYSLQYNIKEYAFSRNDIDVKLINLQIEVFRLFRVLLYVMPDDTLYCELLPALRFLLQWHYQYLLFENKNYILYQHITSIIMLIESGISSTNYTLLEEILQLCIGKWFTLAKNDNSALEFAQTLLLAACLSLMKKIITFSATNLYEFLNVYMIQYLNSNNFNELCNQLSCSIIKNLLNDRSKNHAALLNLGTIIFSNSENIPKLIISQRFSLIFLNNLYEFIIEIIKYKELLKLNNDYIKNLITLLYTNNIKEYLFNVFNNENIISNWYIKYEIIFLLNMIKLFYDKNIIDSEKLLYITCKLISLLNCQQVEDILFLFKNILFSINYYKLNGIAYNNENFQKWFNLYAFHFMSANGLTAYESKNQLIIAEWKPLLTSDWPYSLMPLLLSRYLKSSLQNDNLPDLAVSDEEILLSSLSFTELLELNKCVLISDTEKLIYLMLAFFGSDCKFLEKNIKILLKRQINQLIQNKSKNQQVAADDINKQYFDFDKKFIGKSDFENLYLLFLEQFQASSYSDDNFSALIMIPLAQHCNIKWRNTIWSEHAAVLRFINCDETQLIGGINSYLMPVENDVHLLKCYNNALKMNLLRENSIPYKIAKHHINNYKKI